MSSKIKPETLAKADEIIARYPQKRSATLPLLHLAQEDLGHISSEVIEWVAAKVGTTPMEVLGVVTFYPMFHQHPIGKRHIRVCRTLSCALRGSYHTMEALEKEFGIQRGETSEDGAVTLEFVECIASCGSGPVVHVDHALYENISPDKVKELASNIRASLGDVEYGAKELVPGTPGWNG